MTGTPKQSRYCSQRCLEGAKAARAEDLKRQRQEAKPERKCRVCGASIEDRAPRAKMCVPCAQGRWKEMTKANASATYARDRASRRECTHPLCHRLQPHTPSKRAESGLCYVHEKRRLAGEDLGGGYKRREGATEGTRRKTPNGYIRVKTPGRGHGWTREHTIVMEAYIGRHLLPDEQVHHVNGRRDDNRIENLELWSKSHPAGQRVADKLAWAKEIIQRYGDLVERMEWA